MQLEAYVGFDTSTVTDPVTACVASVSNTVTDPITEFQGKIL